ncbi:septum formation protein Maf [bacterium]|nr:septum formation protein Maf [bacterium]
MSDDLLVPAIILASISPRRQMLLRQVGIEFDIIPPGGDEVMPVKEDFIETVVRNAKAKAVSVLSKANGRLVLGADTLVNIDGEPLGKPTNREDALRMLHRLSGSDHFVYTGIALIDPDSDFRYLDHETTKVTFRKLSDEEIEAYIRTGEPMDKAGSYGIQERGAAFISRVEGCFFNVMGLPLAKLWEALINWRKNQ